MIDFPLPTILAHRGNHSVHPENTLAAFRAAESAGAGWLEFDVMLSLDKIAVVFHDEWLEAMTNGYGLVADHCFSDLQQLTVKLRGQSNSEITAEQIPSLTQFLAYIKTTELAFNLEIKANQLGDVLTSQQVLADLTASGLLATFIQQQRIVLSSFSKAAIMWLAEHAPMIPRAFLIRHFDEEAIAFAQKHQCISVNFDQAMPQALEFLNLALAAAMPTLCFTVNSEVEARAWLDAGVKGIFTNNTACYFLKRDEA